MLADTELAHVVRTKAEAIAEAVAQAMEKMPKWQSEYKKYVGTRSEYLALHFQVFPDYAAAYFERGDVTFRHLFLGELIKALYVSDADPKVANEQTNPVLAALQSLVESVFANSLSPEAWTRFARFLDEIAQTLKATDRKIQRVLLVGDCLFLDIVPFIVADLMDAGIRLVPEYATSKNPALLRDELRTHSAKKIDLVFFSPFSYEFSLEYTQLLDWRNSLTTKSALSELVQRTWDDTRRTIEVLADLFDCPIHIHNSAAVVREQNLAKRVVKAGATARVRSFARDKINALLSAYIHERNAESFQHLFLFDEQRSMEAVGEIEAGSLFYKTPLHHPAVLGKLFSRQYVDLIYVNAWLIKKKVVVCDLDNTLWEGVIGEGAVTHYHDRQLILKSLKSKGVLLAINSKNDPTNVHWRAGTLTDDDFVCAAVSWEPKVHGMQRIQSALNLKIKDYVFIDDREDERELMSLAYPDTLCLDGSDARTWRRMALWEQLLEEDHDMDRTQMYKEREARKAFIQDDISSPEERADLFRSLELQLTIQSAQAIDLKRITELINRTNQFNLEGSRTTFREVSAWHKSPDHLILLGQTGDRFGDMGTTCIAVVECNESEMRILPFVLSCRVFGYGIEQVVMNRLKQIARQKGLARIIGRYQATPQNAPCKDFLADNGFVNKDELWSFDVAAGPELPDPVWVKITIL
jgi:FkbH-like protein